MQKSQLLSTPDGKVVETLTDARLIATLAGVTLGNAAEKHLFRQARSMFGVAVPGPGGTVNFYAAKADGTADTTQTSPQYRVNRNAARAAGIVGAVALIEFTGNENNPATGPAQYGLLGALSIWGCHLIQDLVPGLR